MLPPKKELQHFTRDEIGVRCDEMLFHVRCEDAFRECDPRIFRHAGGVASPGTLCENGRLSICRSALFWQAKKKTPEEFGEEVSGPRTNTPSTDLRGPKIVLSAAAPTGGMVHSTVQYST